MSTKKQEAKGMNTFQALVQEIKKTDTFDKELARNLVSDKIDLLMKKEGVSKADLARRLGKSRAYVTKILQGNTNFTLDSLVQIARALGSEFVPFFVPQEWKPGQQIHISAKPSIRKSSETNEVLGGA